jgi:methanethiol oxidase
MLRLSIPTTGAKTMSIRKTAAMATLAALLPIAALADETCNSPYMGKLIKGQEDFVHVWVLGVKGLGDGNDKLVTIDVNPQSKQYGQVIHKISVAGRGESHHMGFTDDRRYLWAGRLDDSKIFVFDLKNPAKPTLTRTIADLPAKTGFVGPRCPAACWCRPCPTPKTTAAAPAW